ARDELVFTGPYLAVEAREDAVAPENERETDHVRGFELRRDLGERGALWNVHADGVRSCGVAIQDRPHDEEHAAGDGGQRDANRDDKRPDEAAFHDASVPSRSR